MSGPNLIYPPSTGGGGGGVSGSGTPNFLPIWSTATSLSDSPLSFSGSTLTYSSALATHAFAVPQTWTLPANTQAWRINGQQLVFDGGSGYLGINPPTSPAAPLHVEGSVGTSELVRLRNTSTALASPVGIQAHAANRGATTPTGKIENYPISFSPLYGVYDWVYSLPDPSNVMTEVFRQTAPTTILTLTLTSGGSGYTNGTYSQVALTNVSSSGSGATADIVVAGGIVTVAVLRSGGSTYQVGDTLTCASIGGGTGFVLTVASVGSRATAAGNVTATRIGAGTTTPRATGDFRGQVLVDGFGSLIETAWSGQVFNFNTAFGVIGNYTPTTLFRGVTVNPLVDIRSATIKQAFGMQGEPAITDSNVGDAPSTIGVGSFAARSYANDLATGASLFGALVNVQVLSSLGAASTGSVSGYAANFTLSKAHTIATASGFDFSPGTIASTVTNFYGLRLQAPTVTGAITNRWGISQEDAAAKNYFAGNVGFGTASPSTRLHVSDNSSIPVIVQSSGSTDSYLRFINTANNLGYIGYIGTNLYLAPNNGAGNVGIGTTNPGARLHSVAADGTYQFAVSGTTKGIRFLTTASVAQIDAVDQTLSASYQPLVLNGSGLSFGIAGGTKWGINTSGQFFAASGNSGTAAAPTFCESTGVSGIYFPSATTVAIAANGSIAATFSKVAGAGVALGGTTGLVFDASGSQQGVKLRATPDSLDSQTLDCYQDGGAANSGGVTWAPVLRFGGATTGITGSQVGRYTRIGNMVFAQGTIALSSKGSATGAATIAGLPTSANVAATIYYSIAIGYNSKVTFTGQLHGLISVNSGIVELYQTSTAGVVSAITNTDFAADSVLTFTVCYPVT